MGSSIKQHLVLAVYATVFSLGVLGKTHWDFALLFGFSIFLAYQWLEERRNHWIYLLLASVTSVFYAYVLSPFSVGFALYCCLGILVYSYEKGIKWRNIPFLKPVLIACCWFALGIGIPQLARYNHISLISLTHLLLFFVLAIVEDLADMSVDEGHIKTIPLYLSKSTTEILIVVLLFSYLTLSPIFSIFSPIPGIQIASYLTLLTPWIYFYYMKRSEHINHRYFDFILFLIGMLHLLVQNR